VGRITKITEERTLPTRTPLKPLSIIRLCIGSILCDSDVSLSRIQCTPAFVADFLSTSNDTFEEVLGSGPNVIKITLLVIMLLFVLFGISLVRVMHFLPRLVLYLLSLVRPYGIQTLQ